MGIRVIKGILTIERGRIQETEDSIQHIEDGRVAS